jgi:hypothetical protein
MPVRRAHLDRLGRLATIAQGSARAASGRLSGLKQIIHVSDLLLVEPLSGGPDLHPRFPKPRKPTLKAPLPQGGAFAFTVVRMRHVGGRGPVPELTSMADIKLNARLSLRTAQTSLAWPQSRRLAAPSMACVLCDQGSLRALEAAPPPTRQRPRGRYAAWPDAGTVPLLARFRRRSINCEAVRMFP